MNCTFCGEEYEFSLGHRCRVMQEESKQPQPDLVSKLREAISSKRKWANTVIEVSADSGYFCAGDIIAFCDELESLLGLEGQAAPATVPQRKVDFCGAVCMAWEDCGDKEYTHHCVLQADHQGKHKFSCSQVAQPAPSPSTPIVPGTAGLSAEQVQRIVELHHNDGIFLWASMTADLNALLGAAKPAEPTLTMERARNLSRSYLYGAMGHLGISVLKDEAVESVAERLFGDFLAERPALAGEVKEEK